MSRVTAAVKSRLDGIGAMFGSHPFKRDELYGKEEVIMLARWVETLCMKLEVMDRFNGVCDEEQVIGT